MIADYVIHYNDDVYRHHIPVWFEPDTMTATPLDDGVGEYFEPVDPIGNDWDNDSYEEIVADGVVYPAVQDWDLEGIEHMDELHGEGNYVIFSVLE